MFFAMRTRATPALHGPQRAQGDPHGVIEGMAVAAYAVGARKGFVYVRAEYPLPSSAWDRHNAGPEYGLLGEIFSEACSISTSKSAWGRARSCAAKKPRS